jgi:hypothetical protein
MEQTNNLTGSVKY